MNTHPARAIMGKPLKADSTLTDGEVRQLVQTWQHHDRAAKAKHGDARSGHRMIQRKIEATLRNCRRGNIALALEDRRAPHLKNGFPRESASAASCREAGNKEIEELYR